MVLISMTVLIIMGTLFTTISMRSYLYSYAKLCKQQAYYTAMSSVESFHSLLKSNPGIIGTITQELNRALDEDINDGIDPTNVTVTIGSTYGGDGSSYVPNGFFDSYMGRCTLRARYANVNRNEISIEANATYKGYSDFARAKIARTNAAASELKKIFDNTFCLQSPISTLIGSVPNGDIYISQPVLPEFVGNDNQPLKDGWQGDYNEVLAALKEYGNYKGYSALPGQYIRDAQGNVIVSGATEEIRNYNTVLRNQLYGDVQASTGNSDLTGHTRTADVDNYPMAKDAGYTYYNDWVELYMFAPVIGSGSGSVNTAVNGNVYANSRVLIGLLDRDKSNTYYPWTWDDTRKRMVYPGDAEAAAWLMGDLSYTDYISAGDNRDNYEHGFDSDVFFDHVNNNIPAEDTTFRINGNMYFWDDTRIENFDSVNTYNAYQGIKNNIYARKDLAIDGYVFQRWNGSSRVHKKSVSIFGDIMVQGDLYIANSTIYGDVYCNGDNLTILDSTIYGNVYLRGNNFSIDNSVIKSGTLTFKDGNGLSINCPGGNLVIAGLESDCITESNALCTSYLNTNEYGAYIKNTSVTETLYSKVNTKIIVAKWEGDDVYREIFGNIFVEGYLNIDLEYTNDAYINYLKTGASMEDSKNNETAMRYNTIDVTGNLVANKLRIKQSQHKTNAWSGLEAPHLNFNNVFVGTGGTYIDGNEWYGGFTLEGNRKSIYLDTLYTVGLSVWDTDYDLTINPNVLGSWLSSFGVTYSGAVLSQASDAVFAHQINNFATYGGVESIHFSAGQSLNLWSQYFFPTTWETKEANPQFWNAPVAAADETSPLGVYYYDINSYISNGDIRSGIQSYVAATGRTDVASVDNVNKVIEIKKSMVFTSRIKDTLSSLILLMTTCILNSRRA